MIDNFSHFVFRLTLKLAVLCWLGVAPVCLGVAPVLAEAAMDDVAKDDVAKDEATNQGGDVSTMKILLVAGGCCHDYPAQTKLLKTGIQSRLDCEVTVALSLDTTGKEKFEVYESDDWADGYDVIIHDECSARVTDQDYLDRILAAHRDGVPAVNLHCAMHSYRRGNYREPLEPTANNGRWFEMIGVQSSAHGPKTPVRLEHIATEHPITIGMDDWVTINEELYNNVRVFAGATALITGHQTNPPTPSQLQANPDAKPTTSTAVVAWTNQYGPDKTRIFSTTIGHQNETVGDPRYLDLVVRGIEWVKGDLESVVSGVEK